LQKQKLLEKCNKKTRLPSSPICADVLFESHLNAGDEVPVPNGVEDAVAKFEGHEILDNFFRKEVVYAEPEE
jgi:hypothetical protein